MDASECGPRARHASLLSPSPPSSVGVTAASLQRQSRRPWSRHTTARVREILCAEPGPTSVVPIRIVRAVIVANVCIGGKGPFPFVVDTGDATSLVDSSLAARLHLALVDGPRTVTSFTCKRQISFAALSRWSVGNTTLPPQTVEVGTVRSRSFRTWTGSSARTH